MQYFKNYNKYKNNNNNNNKKINLLYSFELNMLEFVYSKFNIQGIITKIQ